MKIIYKSHKQYLEGTERDVSIPKVKPMLDWCLGLDPSSTSYGMALYTRDLSEVHLFTFFRGDFETAESFREVLYDWLSNYLAGIKIQVATFERTPEGYKPPSSHAEKVMRETEAAARNFVKDRNYLYVEHRDRIFDIFPNSWKSFCIPKDRENLGKVDKELNARAILKKANLDEDFWLKELILISHKHDFDCFEALGVGLYGSHFILTEDQEVRVFKNFSKIGTNLVTAKRVNLEDGLGQELNFVGMMGSGRQPRICTLNENHSLPENLLGLHDKEYNNILLLPHDNPFKVYIDMAFGFDVKDTRGYLILGVKTSRTEMGFDLCKSHGYTPIYI